MNRHDRAREEVVVMGNAPGDAMQSITNGLQLLDQIGDESARRAGEQPVHGASAKRIGDKIEIVDHGYSIEVRQDRLAFNDWDAGYYKVLNNRIRSRWTQYLKYMDDEPDWEPHEAGQMKMRMNDVKNALCTDLNELVRLFQAVLQIGLPDHYSHFRICNQ